MVPPLIIIGDCLDRPDPVKQRGHPRLDDRDQARYRAQHERRRNHLRVDLRQMID
jgi:hypothetical protein